MRAAARPTPTTAATGSLTKATPQGTLNYTYDAAGNVTSIRRRGWAGPMSYAYDAAQPPGQRHRCQRRHHLQLRPGGQSGRVPVSQRGGAPLHLQHAQPPGQPHRRQGGTTIASYTYTLGPAGNRTAVTEANGRQVDYSYDALYRLTGEAINADPSGPNGTIGYVYDRVGNRLTRTSSVSGDRCQAFAYDANDRITTESYDANGNTLGSGADLRVRLREPADQRGWRGELCLQRGWDSGREDGGWGDDAVPGG
jgi:YD repeat-containing protein